MKLFEIFISVLEETLKLLFEVLEGIFSASKKKGYNASFAFASSVLGRWEKGYCLAGNGRNLSVKDSYQNALIIGGTGTGKSSVTLIPSLYTMSGSFITHDPSGELFLKSAGYLKEKKYEVKRLNFANPSVSCGYNPLHRANSSSEIQKISSMLVQNSLNNGNGNSSENFWNTQAVALIAMMITILKTQERQYQNLFNVRHLLNSLGSNPKAIDKLFSRCADEKLFSEYKSFLAYDERVVSGVIASCKAALQIFSDEAVAKVTCHDNLDMEAFRKRPTVLYINNSVADQRYYAVLTSIFFEQFFAYILSRFPGQGEQDIWFLIDEASSLKLPTISLAVANVRKHRAGILLAIQDFNQLIHNYRKYEADAIRSNCFAKMYFTGQNLETARDLEQILGRFEYEDDKKRKITRELMTRDEIRTMKINRALLVCGHHPPILARLKPYYESRLFRLYSELPPPVLPNYLPDTLPSLTLNDN
ncbi:MAG: type IV secretory system conjugative DNA transfer family protein [Bacteroidetes bacterium]|nr:type IV secretory system conjugative DNA transfer family protein [Bacteroidota bacterium]